MKVHIGEVDRQRVGLTLFFVIYYGLNKTSIKHTAHSTCKPRRAKEDDMATASPNTSSTSEPRADFRDDGAIELRAVRDNSRGNSRVEENRGEGLATYMLAVLFDV